MKKIITIFSLLFVLHALVDAQIEQFSNFQLSFMLDSIVSNNMEANHIPGVSYALVKNDKVIHVGAKGFAEIEAQKGVTSSTTFMLGSIAKLVTTVAVLQLYEAGNVELDVDIKNYLQSFQMPYAVTLRQLLTHTAGIEESVFNRVKLAPEKLLPLENYLENNLPEQIFPPGKYPAYSNHGMAIAGLVVQEISGQNFEDFVRERIFKPLEMHHSSFRLNEKENLAIPYRVSNGQLNQTVVEYVQTIPASMLISNAEDMAKFMLFLLSPKDNSVIQPATLQLMKTTQYTPHPNLWGRGFGFFERNFRGIPMIEHGGSRNGYYGQLTLAPNDSLGIFIVFNGGKSSFRRKVIYDFLGQIYPKIEREKNFGREKVNLAPYEGTYLSNRRGISDFGKLILQATFVEKIEVKATKEGTLKLLGSDYQLASEDQFEVTNNPTASFPIAFGRNTDGKIADLFLPGRSDSLQKMRWYEKEEIGILAIIFAVLVFLFLTIKNIIRIFNRTFNFQINGSNSFPTYQLLYAVINLFFLVALISTLIIKGESLQYKIPSSLYFIFSLSLLSLMPLIAMIYQFAGNWQLFPPKTKITHGLFLVFLLIYNWQLYYWNLIGFNF